MIEEKLAHHEEQLAQWQQRYQELLNALRECEQQMIANASVVDALRSLLATDTEE